jgi:chromate transporter
MNPEPNSAAVEPARVSLTRFVGYFLRLGTVGFGGPIALAGHMQQDLVEHREWVRKEDYLEGLALAQLAPGPLAAQLAIYLGYIRAGVLGATAVGVAFVLPSFLMVLGLSAAYVRFGGLPWMQGMFYGIGAAVIGIIARSAFKLTCFRQFEFRSRRRHNCKNLFHRESPFGAVFRHLRSHLVARCNALRRICANS